MLKLSILSAILPLIAANAHSLVEPATVTETPPQTNTATRSFTPEDFTRFSPKTALDMVRQIPGFQIEQQDNSQRGFGQATGNVLINGQRLSGKSNDAVEALGRIPAASVARIDIQDGAQLDIPGLSGQVANIIATQSAGLSGAWSTESQFRRNLDPSFLNGAISVSGRYKSVDWTLSLENESPRRGNEGIEQVFSGAGELIELRDEEVRFSNEEPSISLTLAFRPENGNIANFNASYGRDNFAVREIGLRSPIGIPEDDTLRLFRFGRDDQTGEISGDFEFGLGPGRLKLIGVQSYRDNFRPSQIVTTVLADGAASGSRFEQESQKIESIARLEYALSPKPGRDWQISVEGAFNSLDNTSSLFDVDTTGGLVPTDSIDQNTRVEELRAEGNLTHGRKLTRTLTAQASLGVELSELSQSGPTGLTRTFIRPKGFASLAWTPSQKTTVSTRIEREVGQLDFFDFVSTVNLNLANEQLGNPDIVPQQAWLAEVELEQRLGDVGAFTVRVFGESITDIVDQIPIGDTGEAPGNLEGTAKRYGIEANTTLRLDRYGLSGVQLELEGEARKSELDDPLTGLTRRINNDLVSRIFAELRWDVPSTTYAAGIFYFQRREARRFRLDQSTFQSATPGNLGIFFEHKDIFGLIGTVRVNNLLGTDDFEEREVFIDRRNNSGVDFLESRNRSFGRVVALELRGSF